MAHARDTVALGLELPKTFLCAQLGPSTGVVERESQHVVIIDSKGDTVAPKFGINDAVLAKRSAVRREKRLERRRPGFAVADVNYIARHAVGPVAAQSRFPPVTCSIAK